MLFIKKNNERTIIYPLGSNVKSPAMVLAIGVVVLLIVLILMYVLCVWWLGTSGVFLCLGSGFSSLCYSFQMLEKIIISENQLFYRRGGSGSLCIVPWSDISKIRLSDEKVLLIYNRDGEEDYSLKLSRKYGVGSSYYSRDDIQILLNLLAQKTSVIVDEKIAKEENYTLPVSIRANKHSTGRHRNIQNNNTPLPQENTKQKSVKPRMVELDIPHSPNPRKSHKRQLEL